MRDNSFCSSEQRVLLEITDENPVKSFNETDKLFEKCSFLQFSLQHPASQVQIWIQNLIIQTRTVRVPRRK